MSLTPRQLFDFAAGLDPALSEAHARSAISRAYYALLHRANEVTPAQFERPADKGATHERVIAAVQRHGNSLLAGRGRARELMHVLRELKELRIDADYRLEDTVTEVQARKGIIQARIALGWCDEIDRQLAQSTPPSGG